ncbi:MAG: glycosyltransferase family 4 protein [Flavobacteriaceae bacterium]
MKEKKKIVFFGIKYFPSKGGTSRVVEGLLWGLRDQYDITIYCYKDAQAQENIPGVRTIQFREIPIKGFGVFLYYLRCCLHMMVFGTYDLVHVHKTDAAFFIPLLKVRFKVIATSHAIPYFNDKWSHIGKRYFKMAERIFMRSSPTVTSISKALAAYYQEKYGRPVHFIPNGILISEPGTVENAQGTLKAHGVNGKYILFAARRILPLKGCHTLIQALDQIGFKDTLVISGDDAQLPTYTQQLREDAKNLDVRFVGYISEKDILNGLINGADFFVFPSEMEGMSMMLLEAAFNGTPMICSDIPQNKDVLGDDEVLYFESKNASDLAEKIQYAYSHREAMEQMAVRAKQKIISKYNVEHVVDQYIELYTAVLAHVE